MSLNSLSGNESKRRYLFDYASEHEELFCVHLAFESFGLLVKSPRGMFYSRLMSK